MLAVTYVLRLMGVILLTAGAAGAGLLRGATDRVGGPLVVAGDDRRAGDPTPENIIINNKEAERAYPNYLYEFANYPADITSADRKAWCGAYSCPANREAGYNYYRAMSQDATWDIANAMPKLTITVAGTGGTSTAQSFTSVDTDVHTVVVPNSGHYIRDLPSLALPAPARADPPWAL